MIPHRNAWSDQSGTRLYQQQNAHSQRPTVRSAAPREIAKVGGGGLRGDDGGRRECRRVGAIEIGVLCGRSGTRDPSKNVGWPGAHAWDRFLPLISRNDPSCLLARSDRTPVTSGSRPRSGRQESRNSRACLSKGAAVLLLWPGFSPGPRTGRPGEPLSWPARPTGRPCASTGESVLGQRTLRSRCRSSGRWRSVGSAGRCRRARPCRGREPGGR